MGRGENVGESFIVSWKTHRLHLRSGSTSCHQTCMSMLSPLIIKKDSHLCIVFYFGEGGGRLDRLPLPCETVLGKGKLFKIDTRSIKMTFCPDSEKWTNFSVQVYYSIVLVMGISNITTLQIVDSKFWTSTFMLGDSNMPAFIETANISPQKSTSIFWEHLSTSTCLHKKNVMGYQVVGIF